MEIPKPSQGDRDRFHALVPADERVQVKPMFGNLGAYVNGNMFMGLFGADVGLKLPELDAERLRRAGGGPFGPRERPMGGYTALPEALRDDEDRARPWVDLALEHVAALPPKAPKPPKAPRSA
jgi:TfoX/Sxy family transcriptional regulator of competence genes